MRTVLCLAAFALMGAPALADSHANEKQVYTGHEKQTYRFGATYDVTSAPTANACQSTCADEQQCNAWSYVQPLKSAPAYCELKRSSGQTEHNPAAVSGLSPRLMDAFYNQPMPGNSDEDDTLEGGPSTQVSATTVTTSRLLSAAASAPTMTYSTATSDMAAPASTATSQKAPTISSIKIRYQYAQP